MERSPSLEIEKGRENLETTKTPNENEDLPPSMDSSNVNQGKCDNSPTVWSPTNQERTDQYLDTVPLIHSNEILDYNSKTKIEKVRFSEIDGSLDLERFRPRGWDFRNARDEFYQEHPGC